MWTRSENSYTGPPWFAVASEAGRMAASDQQRETEDGAQRQHHPDRQVGVNRLSAGRRARLGAPTGDRRFVDPQRQIAAPLQAGLVSGPVADPILGRAECDGAGLRCA